MLSKTLIVIAASVGTLSSVPMLNRIVDGLIFYPEVLAADHEFAFDTPFEEVTWARPGGATIHGILFSAATDAPPGDAAETRPTVLYFHGNAGSLRTWGDVGSHFARLGVDTLMVDYRGYGKSTGERTEVALQQDADAVYRWLRARLGGEDNIIVYGRSLGSSMASYLGGRNHPRRVILETPFVDLADVAQKHFPILPVRWLLPYAFDNAAHLTRTPAPVTIFHGTADTVVPYASGRALYERLKAADKRVEFITIEGGEHNTLSAHKDFAAAQRRVLTAPPL